MKSLGVWGMVVVAVWGGSGCLAPATTTVVEKRPIKRTYTVPKVKTEASPDGFRFTSPHFAVHFAPEMAQAEGYKTLQERTSRGLGALLFLESQYAFLTEVFGIEAPTVIPVFVAPNIRGDEHDAYTQTNWRRTEEGHIEVAVGVFFGVGAFGSPSVRAHEMAHAFTSIYGLPAWLSEGIAVLVEAELTGGAMWARSRKNLKTLGFDANGYNLIQTWRRPGSPLELRSVETYTYSYSIVAELRDRYGDPFFARLFQLLKAKIEAGDIRARDDAEIVALMSQAAGENLTNFFTHTLEFKLEPFPQTQVTSPTPPPRPSQLVDIPPLR